MTKKEQKFPETEKECRKYDVPWFDTPEELMEFINKLDNLNNDYGTAAYAMSLAGTAAFRYIAHRFGCTGFQAGCADLDMLKRIRHIEGPFLIIDLENYLYPQYDLHGRLQDAIDGAKDWFKEQAIKNLKDNPEAAPRVVERWKELAK